MWLELFEWLERACAERLDMEPVGRRRWMTTSPISLTTSVTATTAVASKVSLVRTVPNLDRLAGRPTHPSWAASR